MTSPSPTRRLLLQGAATSVALAAAGSATLFPANAQTEPNRMISIAQMAEMLGGYTTLRISFDNEGVSLAGLLFAPLGANTKRAGVVILGPFGYVKEQSPMQYATRLARDGFVTLIFDPRFSGESGGTPRRLENPVAKISDVKAAIGFLAGRPEVDASRLAALGICQGSSEMIAVCADDPRIKALALVSGQYLYRKNLEGFFGGGGPTLDDRIARGKIAKAKFETTGQVEYTPVVSPTDRSVGLPWPQIHDWYYPWTTQKWNEPSRWENRYPSMNDADLWTFDVQPYAARLTLPSLMIHGEFSDGFIEATNHVFGLIPATQKHLTLVESVFHTRFYDDPIVIDPAAAEVAAWFQARLA